MKPLLKGIADGIEIFVGLTKDGTDRCPEPIRPQPISKSAEKESVVELFDDESMAIYTNFEDSNELAVRLNSLDFAVVELNKLKDRAKQVSPDVDVGMFDISIKSCQKAMSDLRKFIAHYSVAYEMMGPFLKALYTPSVEECYMPKNVLESFEPIIGNLYGFDMQMRSHGGILMRLQVRAGGQESASGRCDQPTGCLHVSLLQYLFSLPLVVIVMLWRAGLALSMFLWTAASNATSASNTAAVSWLIWML
jgi:hypothetical protein